MKKKLKTKNSKILNIENNSTNSISDEIILDTKSSNIDIEDEIKTDNELELKISFLNEELKRNAASFDNELKRKEEEFEKIKEFNLQKFLTDFIVDFSELRKIVNYGVESSSEEVSNWATAFKGVLNNFNKLLMNYKVSEIKVELNDDFDPSIHKTNNTNVDLNNSIVTSIIEEGYSYNGRVIKYALVNLEEKNLIEVKEEVEGKEEL